MAVISLGNIATNKSRMWYWSHWLSMLVPVYTNMYVVWGSIMLLVHTCSTQHEIVQVSCVLTWGNNTLNLTEGWSLRAAAHCGNQRFVMYVTLDPWRIQEAGKYCSCFLVLCGASTEGERPLTRCESSGQLPAVVNTAYIVSNTWADPDSAQALYGGLAG